jgi:hypothetical protein
MLNLHSIASENQTKKEGGFILTTHCLQFTFSFTLFACLDSVYCEENKEGGYHKKRHS